MHADVDWQGQVFGVLLAAGTLLNKKSFTKIKQLIKLTQNAPATPIDQVGAMEFSPFLRS